MNKKTIFGASLGTLLDWYDYTIYGFLSVPIGKLFFPKLQGLTALLYTYAIFAIGYLARPVGGLILGSLGDRFGRKWILILSICLMGITTTLIGFLPTYFKLGIMAAFLLLTLRILQGLSVGSEYMNAAVFLVEHAPSGSRGFFGSMNNVGGGIGCLLGSGIVTILSVALEKESFLNWGWRIPFFMGALTAIVGVFVRMKLSETPTFKQLHKAHLLEQKPVLHALKYQYKEMILAFVLVAAQSVSFYLSTLFFLTWIVTALHLSYTTALLSTTAALIVLVLITCISGMLSDHFGRKKLLTIALFGSALFSIPVFLWLDQKPIFLWKLIVGQSLLAGFAALYNGTLPAMLVELFLAKSRCSALTISYNLSAGIFGGSALLVATYLIKITGNSIAPAFFLSSVSILSLIALFFVKETYQKPLKF